jgi:hypothetical protein
MQVHCIQHTLLSIIRFYCLIIGQKFKAKSLTGLIKVALESNRSRRNLSRVVQHTRDAAATASADPAAAATTAVRAVEWAACLLPHPGGTPMQKLANRETRVGHGATGKGP